MLRQILEWFGSEIWAILEKYRRYTKKLGQGRHRIKNCNCKGKLSGNFLFQVVVWKFASCFFNSSRRWQSKRSTADVKERLQDYGQMSPHNFHNVNLKSAKDMKWLNKWMIDRQTFVKTLMKGGFWTQRIVSTVKEMYNSASVHMLPVLTLLSVQSFFTSW